MQQLLLFEDLKILTVHDTHDPMPCGLCLAGYYTQPLTYQRIHQRRFADIRIAYYVNET